jgi:hypothetical protein
MIPPLSYIMSFTMELSRSKPSVFYRCKLCKHRKTRTVRRMMKYLKFSVPRSVLAS